MGPSQSDKSLVSRHHPVLPTISDGYPELRGRYPCLTAPYAGSLPCGRFPRLACLIHAANVRSEPGSNPSKVFVNRLAAAFFEFNLPLSVCDSKNLTGLTSATSPGLPHAMQPRPTWARVWVTPDFRRQPNPLKASLLPICQRPIWIDPCGPPIGRHQLDRRHPKAIQKSPGLLPATQITQYRSFAVVGEC
jgi:hypothetical protein